MKGLSFPCRAAGPGSDAEGLAESGLDGVLIGGAVMAAKDRKAAVFQFLNIRKGGRV